MTLILLLRFLLSVTSFLRFCLKQCHLGHPGQCARQEIETKTLKKLAADPQFRHMQNKVRLSESTQYLFT